MPEFRVVVRTVQAETYYVVADNEDEIWDWDVELIDPDRVDIVDMTIEDVEEV